MIVYKITNKANNKIYIGATRNRLEDRWAKHLHDCDRGSSLAIHKAMRKYGWINFKIEIIDDNAKTLEELQKLETKYILEYDTLNSDKGYNDRINNYLTHSLPKRITITDVDVMFIRTLYKKQTFGPKYWYDKHFKDKMSFSGFEKIWEGQTWQHIMPEIYTTDALHYYKTHKEGVKGEFNHNAKFKSDLVLEMRKYYITHTADQVWEKYAKDLCHKTSLYNILKGNTYKNIPVFKKIPKDKAHWELNGKVIENIEEYTPVSTISGSGE